MIRSMTAFARCETNASWGNAFWEIRSVNNRYLDVSPRLPEDLRAIETQLRERLRQRLNRGKVDCTLRVNLERGAEGSLELDLELAKQVVAAGEAVAELTRDGRALSSVDLLRWPGVVKPAPLDFDAISSAVLGLLDQAIDELLASREREGARISELITARLDEIADIIGQVRERLPEVLAASRKRLSDRLAEFQAQLDQDRVEQEMAVLAQRLDVDEELDRLETHIAEVRRILGQNKPAGRRLDFMMQELNREANTLGSKSFDTQTTKASVDLKVLIEQMREQIQNIE